MRHLESTSVVFGIPPASQNLAKRVLDDFEKRDSVMVVDLKLQGRKQEKLYMEMMLKEEKIHWQEET